MPSKRTALKIPKRTEVMSEETVRAAQIFDRAAESAENLFYAFERNKARRGTRNKTDQHELNHPRGATTDQEQDLLRAMLVMASAGLDATIKQLIKDCLVKLASSNKQVRDGLVKFVERRLNKDSTDHSAFLARALVGPLTHRVVMKEYILALTGDSLQSADQVCRAAKALGLEHQKLNIDQVQLQAIFKIRNEIIHEFDINLEGARRKRNSRKAAEMVGYTEEILRLSQRFVVEVDAYLVN
jgi:hypothetical protein